MRVLAIVIGLTTGGAVACEQTEGWPPPSASDRPVAGHQCSVVFEPSRAELTQADDLGSGFVLQSIRFPGVCGGEAELVIQDCNSSGALVIGGYWGFDDDVPEGMSFPDNGIIGFHNMRSAFVLAEVKRAIARGVPMSIDQMVARAHALEVPHILEARSTSMLRQNNLRFKLGCGCETLYPDLPGFRG